MKPRGIRNNNPGNIRRSDTLYLGEKDSTDPEFKQFTSMAYGYRAMFMLLYTYQVRYGLNTLQSMIARYAPESENNTTNYIRQVSAWSGIDPNSRLTTTNRDTMIPLVSAMSRFENGVPSVPQEVEQGWGSLSPTFRNNRHESQAPLPSRPPLADRRLYSRRPRAAVSLFLQCKAGNARGDQGRKELFYPNRTIPLLILINRKKLK